MVSLCQPCDIKPTFPHATEFLIKHPLRYLIDSCWDDKMQWGGTEAHQ